MILMMKQILAAACAMAMMLTGAAMAETDVRVTALKGPTAMGMAALMNEAESGAVNGNDYAFTIASAVDEVSPSWSRAKRISPPCRPIWPLCSTTTRRAGRGAGRQHAGRALHRGKRREREQRGGSARQDDLRQRQGRDPEYALNYILSENGVDPEKDVNIEWKSEHAECLAALLAEENAVAMLPQPFVTTAQMKSDKIKVRLDLNAEWDAVQAGSDAPSQLITGVVAARKAFIEENPEAVAAFMESYAASVEFVNANVDEAAELIGKYEIVPAAVAKKAIPACNITFLAGGEMRQALSGYLNVLFEQNPKAVGGALPGEDFYYGGN